MRYSVHQTGFISTAFLIAMCLMMSLIALKSDYIMKADHVYYDLEQHSHAFMQEAYVIQRAKCLLLQEGELDDYEAAGMHVSVFRNPEGYDLYYSGYRIRLFVYEKQIINFYVQKIV